MRGMVQRELWNNKAGLSDEHGGPPCLSLVQAGCHNPIPELLVEFDNNNNVIFTFVKNDLLPFSWVY